MTETASRAKLRAVDRRTVLKVGGATAAALALPMPWLFRPRGKLPPSLRADPRGILDLPPGFSYRVLSRAGDAMSDGYRVPALADGMACFIGPKGTLVLMRNHEIGHVRRLGALHEGQAPPKEAYDASAHGGVTRIVLSAKSLDVLSQNLVLTGTIRNCAGGPSPWGWLSCEETVEDGHGFVFLCPKDATSVRAPKRIDGYGRFNHEAVAIDPKSHVAYLTEDRGDSCLYRFVPKDPRNPFEGKLQALKVPGSPRFDTASEMKIGKPVKIGWVDVPEATPKKDSVRAQAREHGAARIRRGEGIAFHKGRVFVCSTTGGRKHAGQIFVLDPAAATLSLLAEATDTSRLDCPDNITVAPWGDVLLAEDGSGDQFLRGITPAGKVYDIARNAMSSTEFAGVCLSPDAHTLFANIQHDGLTVAIQGPFSKLSA